MSAEVREATSAEPNNETVQTDYILVALDASPHSTAALVAAAEVAAALKLELRGLYVEDINLLHLCGLPFGLEIGSFTANPRRLEQAHMERDFRIQASLLRKIMADVAGRQRVSWSFKVVRGGVTQEVLAAGSAAHMVSLGRVGTTPGKRTGSTAQAVVRNTQRPVIVQSAQNALSGPFTAIYLGDPSSDHAIELAAQLAKAHNAHVDVLMLGQTEVQADALARTFADAEVDAKLYTIPSIEAMTHILRELSVGSVLLPAPLATWLDDISTPVVVVP
ncbi:MAG TPA: universal stress protein [Chloroflexi bacterium]|nr:universal stress protein [Chloroflexota bacterium]